MGEDGGETKHCTLDVLSPSPRGFCIFALSHTERCLLEMHNTPTGMMFLKWYPILVHAGHGEKQKEKTLIPGPVWYVEKLIPAQHCFKPAPAAIGNVP